ncbi:unnamed protein product [Meloidogyne enterolobii]|uniref:Uncharacterized protein n=2 Tax=Meloidogyne enterolobii TaxID=390850 RepID=A0ACB0ZIU1_MELEN
MTAISNITIYYYLFIHCQRRPSRRIDALLSSTVVVLFPRSLLSISGVSQIPIPFCYLIPSIPFPSSLQNFPENIPQILQKIKHRLID